MTVSTMNWLLDVGFDGWERRNSANAWAKFRAGALKVQQEYKGNQYEVKGMKLTDALLKKYPVKGNDGTVCTDGIELTS